MRLQLLLASVVAISGFAVAQPALAAPDNKNVEPFNVTCEGLGELTVSSVSHSNGEAVFLADGQVVVAKRIVGEGETTLSVEGGPTLVFPEQFEEGAKGHGFDGNLVACDFSLTFEDQFTVNRKALRDLELGPEFLGATVHVSSEIHGTAWVVFPGS